MKTSRAAAVIRTVAIIICATCAGTVRAQDPPMPVGSLSASPTFVQIGEKPVLSWNITYPAVVKDIIKITPPGTCTPKVPVTMDVRVIGASVKAVWTNMWGQVTRWEWVQTEATVSINHSAYARIFYDTQEKVKPSKVVFSYSVPAGTPVNFGGRYYFGGWSEHYKSSTASPNVWALVNGDTPPTSTPLYQQPTIDDFIRQYLDGEGRVKIGPRDVIYLMELTHSEKNDSGFDLQDLALLVTFRTKDNNGHGNNVDGVDSSNPGNAPKVDSDPTVDDER